MLIKFKYGEFISYNVKYSYVRTYTFISDSFILKIFTFCIVVSLFYDFIIYLFIFSIYFY